VLNAILITTVVFFGPASVGTSDDGIVRLTHAGNYRLKVEVKNVYEEPICTSRIRFINYSLELHTGDHTEHGRDLVSGRPASGCHMMQPGSSEIYVYDLIDAFPGYRIDGKDICYNLYWSYKSQVTRFDIIVNYQRRSRACLTIDN